MRRRQWGGLSVWSVIVGLSMVAPAAGQESTDLAVDRARPCGIMTCIPSVREAHTYRHLPILSLATSEDGTPRLQLTRWIEDASGEPRAGAFFHAEVSLVPKEADLEAALSSLREDDPEARMAGAAPVEEGRLALVVAGDGSSPAGGTFVIPAPLGAITPAGGSTARAVLYAAPEGEPARALARATDGRAVWLDGSALDAVRRVVDSVSVATTARR
jgi:hypothetical protein